MSVNKVNKTDGSTTLLAGSTLWASNPIGTILAYGGTNIPTGWMLCNGAAISRTTYSELFAVIGESFGAGDGSTTFNLPDMRESVPKGAGLTGKTVGAHLDADGLAVGEFLDDRLQDHKHMVKTWNLTPGSNGGPDYTGIVDDTATTNLYTLNVANVSARTGATTEVKSVGVNYIIKAKMVALPADFVKSMGEFEKYSTDEVLTNKTWIDGKPIYRKVVDYGSLPNSTSVRIAHNITNMDFMTDATGIIYDPSSSATSRTLCWISPSNSTYGISFEVSKTEVIVTTGSDRTNYKAYIILEYTKTTD